MLEFRLEHISKTIIAIVMKFLWIDLIKGSAVHINRNSFFTLFLSYCALFIVILEFCPELIFKPILGIVMKFCGWIDLIKGEWIARLIFELLPFGFFLLEFCPVHISKTILAMVMKFCGWIDLIMG